MIVERDDRLSGSFSMPMVFLPKVTNLTLFAGMRFEPAIRVNENDALVAGLPAALHDE